MIPPSSMFRCSSLVPAKISMIAEPQSGKWECCLIIHSSYAALTVLIPNFIEISCSERFENLTSYFVFCLNDKIINLSRYRFLQSAETYSIFEFNLLF